MSLRQRGMTYLVVAAMGLPAAAQSTRDDPAERTVTREEGETVVQSAWELRKGLDGKPDCSHFVHEVYLRTGLDYEYANSVGIFEGIPEFRRVQKPQPGDLIVWPGHVGIMIDPSEHSFYSSVIKGFAIEDYKSRYWARRGPPRFYRYMINQAQVAHLHANMTATRTAALNKRPPVAGTRSISDEDVSPDDDRSTKSAAAAVHAAEEVEPSDAELLDTVFVSSRSQPLRSEIQTAFTRVTASNAARSLRLGLGNSQNVGIVDEFKIVEMHVHGRFGWAGIEIHETASIENGRAIQQPRSSKWRLVLRREAQGWMMLVPHDKNCLSRNQAIQALTAHLERVSHENANEQELRRTVRVLDDLLGSESRYLPVAGGSSD